MTWTEYARAQEDPEWQKVRDRYLGRTASREVSAQQAMLDRRSDIAEMYRIEKRYEENQ